MKKLSLLFFFSSLLLGSSAISFASEATTAEATIEEAITTTVEENTALEDQVTFKTPTRTPTRSRAGSKEELPKLPPQITPVKPSFTQRDRANTEDLLVQEFDPLKEEEIKLVLNYHTRLFAEGFYRYPLLKYSFSNSLLELKMKIKEISSSSEDHSEFLFHTYDEHGHWSLLWAYRSELETDSELILIYLDSVGFEGKYKRLLIERALGELWKRGSKFSVWMPAPKRQRDDFSCGLFSINDFRALSWYESQRKEEDPSLFSLLSSILREEKVDVHPNFFQLEKFPPLLMQGTQSCSTIERNGASEASHPRSPAPYLLTVQEKGPIAKVKNFFTVLQMVGIRELIEDQRLYEENLPDDAYW